MNSIPASHDYQIVDPDSSSSNTSEVSSILGHVISLMMASPIHKQLNVSDLETLVAPPVRMGQFRLYQHNNMPIGYASWAFVSPEVDTRLATGDMKLSPMEWRCGNTPWLVDLIAPYGYSKQMLDDIKKTTFPGAKLKALQYSAVDGKPCAMEI